MKFFKNPKKVLLPCLFLALLAGLTVTAGYAQPGAPSLLKNPTANSTLWQVSGNGLAKPSFLFGTFHLLCKDDINFSTALRAAFKYSDTVYMELDMDNPATLLGGMAFINMKGNKKLEDLYTPLEYKRVSDYYRDSLQMPFAMLQKAKPYFLIAMIYPKLMPCKTYSGIEEELVKMAKTENKEINGLETIAFQAGLFDSIPYEVQAKELLKSIDSIGNDAQEFDTLRLAYKNQELGSLDTLFTKSEINGYDDLLLKNRNINWVGQLKAIMRKSSVFVAVGAGHLPGPNGVIALLRKEGYVVEPLLNK